MVALIDGVYSISVGSGGGTYTSSLGGTVSKKRRKGTQNVIIDPSDPYGLVAAKLTSTKYALWNETLGHFVSTTK